MKNWLLLASAILLEVAASLSLKAALDNPLWFVMVGIGYIASYFLITRVLKSGVPIGVVYGIWGASGVALTAVFSSLLFNEPLTELMILGIVVIIAGVVCVQIGAERAAAAKRAVA